MADGLVKNAEDFRDIMQFLSPKNRETVYAHFQNKLSSWIMNKKDFEIVTCSLSFEQRFYLFDIFFEIFNLRDISTYKLDADNKNKFLAGFIDTTLCSYMIILMDEETVTKIANDVAKNYEPTRFYCSDKTNTDLSDQIATEIFRAKHASLQNPFTTSFWRKELMSSTREILKHAQSSNRTRDILEEMGVSKDEIKNRCEESVRLKILLFAFVEKRLLYEDAKMNMRNTTRL